MPVAAHTARRPCASRAARRRARSAQRSRPAAEFAPAVSALARRAARARRAATLSISGGPLSISAAGTRAAVAGCRWYERRGVIDRNGNIRQRDAARLRPAHLRRLRARRQVVERWFRRRSVRGGRRRCWNIGWRVRARLAAPRRARCWNVGHCGCLIRGRYRDRRRHGAHTRRPAAHATHRTPVRPDRGIRDLVGGCAVWTDNLHRAVDGSSLAIRAVRLWPRP